jgi:hypothetical protein
MDHIVVIVVIKFIKHMMMLKQLYPNIFEK